MSLTKLRNAQPFAEKIMPCFDWTVRTAAENGVRFYSRTCASLVGTLGPLTIEVCDDGEAFVTGPDHSFEAFVVDKDLTPKRLVEAALAGFERVFGSIEGT